MTPRNGGASRVLPVRLTEIPIHIRRQFGQKLMDAMADDYNLLAGIQLSTAIERPSEKVYWIPVTKKSAPSIRRIFGKDAA
jgi:hypothetical protein